MTTIQLGLKENWQQFSLLVLINMLVGGMVGLERTVVPLIGTDTFQIKSDMVVFSFIVAFGLVKAFTNLLSGVLADRFTRKKVLIGGWLVGLPVPFLLGWGPSWNWIIAANILLGISQGLAWSMTVNMKIDLVGPRKRGMAMGLNEAAGYGAVGITALLTGYWASRYGLRPQPFYIGIVYAFLGLLLSIWLVRDTRRHAQLEALQLEAVVRQPPTQKPGLRQVFTITTYKNNTLFAATQAGFINNLNDGMSWGVFPLLFLSMGVGLEGVGWIKAVYPMVWGIGQIVTGPLADKFGRKPLIVGGMLVQAVGHVIIGLELLSPFQSGVLGSVLLGAGTAMVYPALLAVISDAAHPDWRASSLGVYRFWRDMGYAAGALLSGIIAGVLGLMWAVHLAGLVTFLSGLLVMFQMKETLVDRSH